jgi:phage-related minor tail protein
MKSKGYANMQEMFNSWKIERYKQIQREKNNNVPLNELYRRFGATAVEEALKLNRHMYY